jgi:hypothetical protein
VRMNVFVQWSASLVRLLPRPALSTCCACSSTVPHRKENFVARARNALERGGGGCACFSRPCPASFPSKNEFLYARLCSGALWRVLWAAERAWPTVAHPLCGE